jgi:phage terminase Nu1 subunit (DNA packaging protein)
MPIDLLDARALAGKLHVTPATVLTWARRGWIPSLRAGQRPVLFDLAEVTRALRQRAADQEVGHDRR